MSGSDDLGVLNDRSRPLAERLAAVRRLAQIRGAYTEEEYAAQYRAYGGGWRSPDRQALWELQQRAADETESEALRLACIQAFADISNDQYVIDLRALTHLKTRNATIRRAAIKAATEVRPHPRHLALIADQLVDCEVGNIFTLRSLVSGWGARPGVLETIARWRTHTDPDRRSESAYCLAWLGDLSSAIHNLGHDPDTAVRRMAAFTIGFFGFANPEEASALEAVISDTDVSEEVRRSLKALGLQPIPSPGRAGEPAGIAVNPDRAQWWQTLDGLSRRLLAQQENRIQLDDAVVRSGWLGFPPASDAEIAHLEKRLRKTLPMSFKQYLRVSNGWRQGPSYPERWYGTGEIGWFRELEPEYVRIWTEENFPVSDSDYFVYGAKQNTAMIRTEYLRSCLQVSEVIDGYVYLLNPEVISADGEWEAWVFGSKLAGAIRYRSWAELVAAEVAKL